MRVAVIGATGTIGRAASAALLGRGDAVTAVSRGGAAGITGADDARWDPVDGPPPDAALDGADAVLNLAGAPIEGGRWTAARKRQIHESRVLTTRLLVDALGRGAAPRTLVNASAVGYYGARGDELLDESAPSGDDFLAETCIAWEREAVRAEDHGVRVVRVRTGIVLDREGGALPKLVLPFRFFAGGPIGGGRQWVPWIHIDDEVGLILHALDRDEVAGPLNAGAPEPVRQRDFAAALGRVLGRPSLVPTPAVALRLAMGEMATLALDGQRAVPKAALATGYAFGYTEAEPALRALLG